MSTPLPNLHSNFSLPNMHKATSLSECSTASIYGLNDRLHCVIYEVLMLISRKQVDRTDLLMSNRMLLEPLSTPECN